MTHDWCTNAVRTCVRPYRSVSLTLPFIEA